MNLDDTQRLESYRAYLTLHPRVDEHKLHDILMVIINILLDNEKERGL